MKLKMILLTILLLLGLRYSNAQNGPVVSFTYDDGFSAWYDIGFPLFQQYGFPAVLYINATNSWVSGNGYDAVNKLHEMQDEGWEISNHTWDHSGVFEPVVSSMKTWLDSVGFPNSGFSAPFHDWNHSMVDFVKKYSLYYCAQNSSGIPQPYDRYFLRRVGISNNISIETIKGWLDDAVTNNHWIIFSGHDMGGTYGDSLDGWLQSAQLIQMVCDEIVLRNIPVKTVREVINDLYPPGSDIECSDDSLQYPVLTSFEEDSVVLGPSDTSVWNEYWHKTFWTGPRYVGSPVVYCHTSNDSLPVMKFFRNVPNGEYEVRATIIEYDASGTYRLFYSFDENNPSLDSVDVSQNSDVSLGTVTITNGQFALYTQRADVVSGDDGYVGWAWIVLKPVQHSVTANLKVFLEGSYNGSGSMTTALNNSHLIPLTSDSAYPTATYGYNVSVVGSIPDSSIVDWVFVELRTGTGSETKVASRAAFLKKDGTIVSTDGSSPVSFTGVSAGNYYVVIRHRNHLAVMTASAIPLSSSSTLYDFTTSQSQAYTSGTDPMAALSGGGFGMIAGDGNNSTIITASDVTPIINNLNNSIYNGADVNMSAIVTAADVTKIISNLNRSSNVP